MFKLVVLSALLSIAAAGLVQPLAYTSYNTPAVVAYQPEQKYVVETPTVSQVGTIVKSIPTAVSHQSSSVVHSKADYVEPILAHGVQKTVYTQPAVKTVVQTPAVYAAQPLTYAAAPAQYAYTSPLAYAAPATYAAPASYAYATPTAYSAYSALPAGLTYGAKSLAYSAPVYANGQTVYTSY